MALPRLPMPEPPVGGQQKMIRGRIRKARKSSGGGGGGGMLSDIGRHTSSMAEAIERQANSQQRQAEQKSGLVSTDPIGDLVNQIMGQYGSIQVAPTPYEQLKQIAESQVAAQFDPMIQLLQQQMGQHANTAQRSATKARAMYNALGGDFLSQLPELTQQFAAEDKETNARYNNAQKTLADQYSKQQDQQNAVLQQLGIQAAAPDASKQAQEDQSYLQGQMESDQQSAIDALNQQQRAQSDYTRNLGNTTKVAGENTAQDIRQQLMDYMDQANTQMTGLKAQRGSALASLLQQMQAQDASRVEKEEQQQFSNLMNLANFQLDAAKAMQKASGGDDSLFGGSTTGIPGAQNFLAEKYPDSPILAGNLMEQLNDVLQNKAVTQGKFVLDPGDPSTGEAPRYSDVGQEYILKLLRQELARENASNPGRFGTPDINNAIAAMQAYLGKVR